VIARLEVAALHQRQYVMDSSSGQALAFGPGHLPQSAEPAGSGHVVIAGHRDTHFGFLQRVNIGDMINTEHHAGRRARYRVVDLQVIDVTQQAIEVFDDDILTLVTCYPFNGWMPGGPLRYLVHARRIDRAVQHAASKRSQKSKPDKTTQPAII
jgi:sortase A